MNEYIEALKRYVAENTVINAVPMMRKSNDSTLGTADKKDKSL